MSGQFPYQLRYHYPHMREEDQAIWERFIATNPEFFDSVDYDVAVGSAPDFPTIVTATTGGDDGRLYLKKIDVVGHKGAIKFVVELKPRASAAALGQVLGYKHLYCRDVDTHSDCIPMVITNEASKDLLEVAAALGVQVVVA